jgi:hypothetical protein
MKWTVTLVAETEPVNTPQLCMLSYSYRLTDKGIKVAAMFVLFQKRVCGPLANTLFHHRPTKTATPPARIEVAYHKADVAIQHLVDLLAA